MPPEVTGARRPDEGRRPPGVDLVPATRACGRGFPKRLGTGGEAPLRYADLNGDNTQELIIPTEDGTIHAYRARRLRAARAGPSTPDPDSARRPRRRARLRGDIARRASRRVAP